MTIFKTLFNMLPVTTSTYTYSNGNGSYSTQKSRNNVNKFFESFEHKGGENRTWIYVNKPKEYRVVANDKQVEISSCINGKKLEVTLVEEDALKVQNLLQKMHFSAAPIRPFRPFAPFMPIEPMAPLLLSFNSPEENKMALDRYSHKIEKYDRKCKKEIAKYQSQLETYEKETASHAVNAREHEAARKDLMNLVDLCIGAKNGAAENPKTLLNRIAQRKNSLTTSLKCFLSWVRNLFVFPWTFVFPRTTVNLSMSV